MGKKILPVILLSPILYSGLLSNGLVTPSYAAEEAVSNASVVSYTPDYFVQYSPVTLLDMLERVPGASEILNKNRRGGGGGGGNQRGFGNSGDQILIDGKRLAGKSNNINDALSRISANQIAKIDLIRGATSGLDVQSQGLVINITMIEGASKSTTFWKLFGEYTFGHSFIPKFLVSHSGSSGNLEYSFAIDRNNDNGYRPSDEVFFDGDNNLTGAQVIDHVFKFRGIKITNTLGYNFEDGAELRLNGLFDPNEFIVNELRTETGNDPDSTVWDSHRKNNRWEIGGDYNRELGRLGHSKTLFVINRNTENNEVTRVRNIDTPEFVYANELTDAVRTEKIFRSSITPTIAFGQTIEFGGEAAINTFDKHFDDFGRDAFAAPLLLETSDDVEIKENRYEIFAIHSYNITSSIVVQSSLTTEFSKIIADNNFADGTTNRRDTSFTYLKPRVNVRYDLTARDQFRATVEKKVSQLRFDSFVTSFDAQNDEIRVGNTNLRPTQTWEFILGYEHRLADDAGSIEGTVYYHQRNDHQTRVDFTEYQDFAGNPIGVEEFFNLPPDMALRDLISFTPTQGNIDSAYLYGIDVKSNLRLGFVGMPQAVLTLGYRFEKRKSRDQFTQLLRNFSRHSDHVYKINYRHDVTKWNFAYGFDVDVSSDLANYDMRFIRDQNPAARIKAFAEYNINTSVKMRLDLIEIAGTQGTQTTTRYTDHIRFNEVSKREERNNDRPRAVQVTLQGTF